MKFAICPGCNEKKKIIRAVMNPEPHYNKEGKKRYQVIARVCSRECSDKVLSLLPV